MGLRKLKEYRKAPQMRVLKNEPDKKTKFPTWMIIVLMIAVSTSIFNVSKSRNNPKTIKKYVEKVLSGKQTRPKYIIGKIPSRLTKPLGAVAKTSVKKFSYILTPNSIRHIENNHGLGNEYHKNHKPVEPQDYYTVEDALFEPDSLSAGYDTKRGEHTIKITKSKSDNTYTIILVVGTGSKQLSVKTFYIKTKPR